MEPEELIPELRSKTLGRLVVVFFWACVIGFPVVLVSIGVNTIAPFVDDAITEKAIVAKLTFINLAMIMAVFQLFLGVVLALIGVAINYEIDAQAGSAKLRFVSASPGLLLIILANVLLIIVIWNPVTAIEETGSSNTANGRGTSGSTDLGNKKTFPRDGGNAHQAPGEIK